MHIAHNTHQQRSAYEQEYLTWYKGEGLCHAHAKGFANRKALEATKRCGCFCCERIFHPTAITDWVLDGPGDTAIRLSGGSIPYCRMGWGTPGDG